MVASARKLIGATNPLTSEPGTIRGKSICRVHTTNRPYCVVWVWLLSACLLSVMVGHASALPPCESDPFLMQADASSSCHSPSPPQSHLLAPNNGFVCMQACMKCVLLPPHLILFAIVAPSVAMTHFPTFCTCPASYLR